MEIYRTFDVGRQVYREHRVQSFGNPCEYAGVDDGVGVGPNTRLQNVPKLEQETRRHIPHT